MNNRRMFLGMLGIGGLATVANAATPTQPTAAPPTSKYMGEIQGFQIHRGVWPAYCDQKTVITLYGEHGANAEFSGDGVDIDSSHIDLHQLCQVLDKTRDALLSNRELSYHRYDVTINNIAFKVRCWCGQWQKNRSYDSIRKSILRIS